MIKGANTLRAFFLIQYVILTVLQVLIAVVSHYFIILYAHFISLAHILLACL